MGHDLTGSRNDARCRRQACTPFHHLRDECGKLTQEGRTKCKAKAPPRKLIDAPRQSNQTPLSATKHSANIKPSQPRIIILIVALISSRLARYSHACVLPSTVRQCIRSMLERVPRSIPSPSLLEPTAQLGDCFQDLLVDQFHEPQVLGTLAFWRVIRT